MKKILLINLLLFSQFVFSQEFNVYQISSENRKTNQNAYNLADFLYLSSELKVSNYTVFHYTSVQLKDTVWNNKKKKVVYKNNKIDCDFDLKDKFEKIVESNQMRVVGPMQSHLIIGSEFSQKISDIQRFIVHEIDSDSELALQRELMKIKDQSKKSNITVYIYNEKYNLIKPEISFVKDSIFGNGNIEISFKSSTLSKKVNWSSNVKFLDDDKLKPFVNLTSNQIVTASYVDENGCVSNEDKLFLIFKEDCNCDLVKGKPEILYQKSKNIIERQDDEEADWEYKAIPEQSGSLIYEIPVKNVCGERFLVEIKSTTGKILFTETYEREDVDERSMNPIAVKNKDIIVFILPLDELRSYIETADSYFYVSIIPEISGQECLKRKYTSLKIRFSKCR